MGFFCGSAAQGKNREKRRRELGSSTGGGGGGAYSNIPMIAVSLSFLYFYVFFLCFFSFLSQFSVLILPALILPVLANLIYR